MYYNSTRQQYQQPPQYTQRRQQQQQQYRGQPRSHYRQNNNKPFTLAIGTPNQSRYGDGAYQTLTLKVDGSPRGEYVWKTYLTVNQYGAFTGLTYEDLEELYYALGDLLGATQQHYPQQQQQPKLRQRQDGMPTPPPPAPQSQQDTEEDQEIPF